MPVPGMACVARLYAAAAVSCASLPAALFDVVTHAGAALGGLPPEGFDYGNSPTEFARLDLTGCQLVIATSNGTRALHAVAGAPAAYAGCLLNRSAVCEAAVDAAFQWVAGLCVVCAGNDYGRAFSLDDAGTNEIDDAFSLQRRGDAIRVGIHIAAPALGFGPGSSLDAIARERQTYVNELVQTEAGMAQMSGHIGVDLSRFPPDQPLADMAIEAGSRGSLDVVLQGTQAPGLTLGATLRSPDTVCPIATARKALISSPKLE